MISLFAMVRANVKMSLRNRAALFWKDHGLRWGGPDHGAEPPEGGGAPASLAGRTDSVPQ